MADDLENHTGRLLQEMRQEMRDRFAQVNERFDELDNRVDGNTLILNMIAGLVHDHEERITALEQRAE